MPERDPEDAPIAVEPKGKYQNVVQDDFDEPEGVAV